jgi:hypothetical protein
MAHSSDNNTRQRARVRVERIGTEPMTSHQREQAVEALAALITNWQHSHNCGAEQPGADSATPLPLRGVASDTDDAA